MGILTTWMNDPAGALRSLITMLPAILPALVLHEVAHGFVAWRLGDPTAQRMGRLSLNPLRHLDPMGTLFLIFIGLGWAKPVPVDPRYFKNPRRDDFLVSIAGVTANLIMFLLGCGLMYGMVFFALRAVPEDMWLEGGEFIVRLSDGAYRLPRADAFLYAPGMTDYLVAPYMGAAWGYVYDVIVNFAVINLSLAVFNLLPVPPLDGYHVLNDLLMKKQLFAPAQIMQAGRALLLVLSFTGLLGKGLSWAINGVFAGVGRLALALFGA